MKKHVLFFLFISVVIFSCNVYASDIDDNLGTAATAGWLGNDLNHWNLMDDVRDDIVRLERGTVLVGECYSQGDNYYIDVTPNVTAYVTGMMVTFRAPNANTGACNINLDGLGLLPIKWKNDVDPAADHIEAGTMVTAVFDYSSNVWEMLNYDANP